MGNAWTRKSAAERARGDVAPETPKQLRRVLREGLGLEFVEEALAEGNGAPFDYLVHSYFEGKWGKKKAPGSRRGDHWALEEKDNQAGGEEERSGGWVRARARGPGDCVVWANRGGGKTLLGAVATALDLAFKEGIRITVLGGSLEQSQRMHEHLRKLFETGMLKWRLREATERRLVVEGGGCAEVLAASQASVRGTRVQKMRCDEVELFDPEIWAAAQLTTRSMRGRGRWSGEVRGAVEAYSTMHVPQGLMWGIVAGSRGSDGVKSDVVTEQEEGGRARVLFRWGVLDVLGECGEERVCKGCGLWEECGGRAKERKGAVGHVRIADALRMKSRVSAEAWKSEMMCLQPRRSDSVYPEFDRNVHVGDWDRELWRTAGTEIRGETLELGYSAFIAGMDFGFRAPTVILMAWINGEGVLHVEAEHVEAERTLDQHIGVLKSGVFHQSAQTGPGAAPAVLLPFPAWIGTDPAGDQTNAHTGVSSNNQLRKAGLKVKARRLEVLQGIEVVRARLRPGGEAIRREGVEASSGSGAGVRLLIHKRCEKLIEAMERYHFPADNPHAMEPVKDGFDHCADALRYLVVNLDRPYAPLRVIRYA